ncbi:universal stress protein [Desulfosudis oleivorans]|uniref:UspA domain protein n=1 Tax=Desulfosudis oleivorans (strain DSM 6200 / JCM 39069 / Hxd3) TaxID=96561 RepID=A8ZYM8_DESOH|nr:universal stress protein [Desulfosudis oleivorans]ABW67133.1 UspA domain protein [Desulfosudis oleivorans Hxd3]
MTVPVKFLVLLDGSPRSFHTLDYIAAVRPFRKFYLVLFQVMGEVPEYYWDMVAETGSVHGIQEIERWQRDAKRQSEAFMAEARDRLVSSGFDDGRIETRLHARVVGVARDILEEAKRGYDGVVMRRRGQGNIKGVVVGSVANKLLSRLPDIPVILAGVRNQNKKMLLAVGGAESADRMVATVTAMIGGYDYRIELLHVIRDSGRNDLQGAGAIPADMVDRFAGDIKKRLHDLREKLILAGFAPDSVTETITQGVTSRAEAIVAEAEARDCSTIVMGRRGPSDPEDIVTGSVCSKVIHRGRELTVWIT